MAQPRHTASSQQQLIYRLCRTADKHRERGEYDNAEPLYLQALELAEPAFGPEHEVVSTVCHNLAVLHKYTGKFDEAERLYRRALPIIARVSGFDHTEVD